MAAFDTTGFTLEWLILYLIHYPRVQEKLYEEVRGALGPNRSPSFADRSKLPYVNACIEETLRMAPPAPVALIHRNWGEIDIYGYKFPKDCLFVTNVWGIGNDPDVWGDPEVFRPERHIDENGAYKKSPITIPFSIGTFFLDFSFTILYFNLNLVNHSS